ncbi:MAG: hypothetical protein ACLT9P_01490 [Evtepia gabavorous]
MPCPSGHGGIVFAPKPRITAIASDDRKMKRLAQVLSAKAAGGDLHGGG